MRQTGGWTVVLGMLCAGLVGACGEGPLTPEEFCQAWASAACTPEVVSVCQRNQAVCRSSHTASCREWLPVDFQDAGVRGCLRAVQDAYADADLDAAELDIVWRLRGPCRDIVVTGEGGEPCERDDDCRSSFGLTCVLKDRATGTCERAETVEPGFSCSQAEQICEPGFFCNGEHCVVALDVGDSCQNDTQCKPGHFCQNGLCEEQLPVGADCIVDQECASEICYEVDSNERVCVDRIRLSPAEPACLGLK